MMLELRYSPLELAMRQAIDIAVHTAVEETLRFYKHEGPLDAGALAAELHRTAKVAATGACEQFKTFVNNELRLIEAEWERRASLVKLTPYPVEAKNDQR